MALDFPMETEPQAPPREAIVAHNGNTLGLSAEEEQAVHEEGRRAGVVVRLKTLKKTEPVVTEASVIPAKETPVPKSLSPAEPPPPMEPMFVQMELLPAAASLSTTGSLPSAEPPPVTSAPPRPEPMPEPPPVPKPSPEPGPSPLPDPLPEPGPLPRPEPAPGPTAKKPASVSAAKPTLAEKPKPAPAEKPKSKRGRKSLKEVAAEASLINIPGDEVLFSKQYYTMGEVAEMFHVNQSLLRFWETEFSILQPRKNKKGDRYFRPIDIKNLHLIYHLLRQRKYTIEGAKEFLRKNKTADQRFEAIQRLQQIKAFLLELKAQL